MDGRGRYRGLFRRILKEVRVRAACGLTVAALATLLVLHAECHCEPMAGPAEFAVLHLPHGVVLPGGAGEDDLVVAIGARVTFATVYLVAEGHVAGIARHLVFDGFRDGMALLAGAGNRKSGFAVMTGAAGGALLHLGHVHPPVPGARYEQGVMTVVAPVHAGVKGMAESGADREIYLLDRVTFGAVFLDSEGGFTLMAGAA